LDIFFLSSYFTILTIQLPSREGWLPELGHHVCIVDSKKEEEEGDILSLSLRTCPVIVHNTSDDIYESELSKTAASSCKGGRANMYPDENQAFYYKER
jgi:hypothetical protein